MFACIIIKKGIIVLIENDFLIGEGMLTKSRLLSNLILNIWNFIVVLEHICSWVFVSWQDILACRINCSIWLTTLFNENLERNYFRDTFRNKYSRRATSFLMNLATSCTTWRCWFIALGQENSNLKFLSSHSGAYSQGEWSQRLYLWTQEFNIVSCFSLNTWFYTSSCLSLGNKTQIEKILLILTHKQSF